MSDSIRSTSPVDGATLGEVPVADASLVAERAARADEAFRARWRDVPVATRVVLLRRLRSAVLRRHRSLAEAIAREQGKPVLEAMVAEVFPVLDALSFLIHRGPRALRPRRAPHFQPFLAARRARIHMRPYGVWAVIAPWNYPFSIPMAQIATILCGGGGVVFKPSPLTPLIGDAIVDLCREAGFDESLVQIVHGGADVGEALVADPRVRAVVFTGGVAGGRRVMEIAAGGPKKVLLELGGKDPAIVCADADLERTARGIAWSSMVNAGQTCASVERVYVDHAVREAFIDRLVAEVSALRVGDPLSDDVDLGPLTSESQLVKVVEHVDDAVSRGATVAVGGRRREDLGALFHEPTIVLDPPSASRIAREETFGPVVTVETFRDTEEAVRRANESAFGLTASIWTRDPGRVRVLAPKLECGVVTLNTHLTTYGESNSVWGGCKDSGFGRTHGVQGLLETVEAQYVDEELSGKPEIWWYPYTPRFGAVLEDLVTFLRDPSVRVRMACLLRLAPRLGYLAKHLSVTRMGPGLLRYFL